MAVGTGATETSFSVEWSQSRLFSVLFSGTRDAIILDVQLGTNVGLCTGQNLRKPVY